MTQTVLIPNTPEWHENRRTFIGGSDAAAALGLSKWKTPYQLYLEKIGEAEPEEETWEMMRGKAMEPLLRQEYSNSTGREVLLPPKSIVSEKYPFMGFNPDGITHCRRGVELKTAAYGKEWGEVESDEIPQDYILQVQHGMIVMKLDVFDVRVSIAGNQPKPFIVEADKELQEMIIENEHNFWYNNVLARVIPDPISNEDVKTRYKISTATSIVATDEIKEALMKLKSLKKAIKETDSDKEELEVILKSFLGDNDTLIDENKKIIATWKKSSDSVNSFLNEVEFRKDHPDLYQKYQYTDTKPGSRRFLIK